MAFQKFMSVVLAREAVFDMLPTGSLTAFASTSFANHAAVVMYLKHRVAHQLTRFVSSPHEFLLTLGITHAVISGSTALKILFGYECTSWLSSDLDIYAPVGCTGPLHTYLLVEGYLESGTVSRSPYAGSAVNTITTFRRGEVKVDVVESRNETALTPIFEFHSTALMNFVSMKTIFSAYPLLTAVGRTVINPGVFHNGRVKIPVLSALLKYHERGFDVQTTAEARKDDMHFNPSGHICGTASACPCTFRNTHDKVALWMHLEEQLDDGEEVAALGSVTWRLGGHRCTQTDGYILPYVF